MIGSCLLSGLFISLVSFVVLFGCCLEISEYNFQSCSTKHNIFNVNLSFGRKSVLICATLFMSITGICQALAWNYQVFIVFAFLNAIGISGVYPSKFNYKL